MYTRVANDRVYIAPTGTEIGTAGAVIGPEHPQIRGLWIRSSETKDENLTARVDASANPKPTTNFC